MRGIILCEESQALTKAFRFYGHEVYSCDVLPCSGGHPEWHYQMEAREALKKGPWDFVIMHPPCTKVSVSGNGTYADTQERIDAANWNADLFFDACKECDFVAMEQPVTVLQSIRPDLPKPQYVDLWWFGDRECKKTAWYTKGFPKLAMTDNVGPPPKGKARHEWMKTWLMSPSADRGHLRSKLNPKMARAVADQWGSFCQEHYRYKGGWHGHYPNFNKVITPS